MRKRKIALTRRAMGAVGECAAYRIYVQEGCNGDPQHVDVEYIYYLHKREMLLYRMGPCGLIYKRFLTYLLLFSFFLILPFCLLIAFCNDHIQLTLGFILNSTNILHCQAKPLIYPTKGLSMSQQHNIS